MARTATRPPLAKVLVAYCRGNRVIGADKTLPWPRLKGDLPRFKRMTLGGALIMGRTTWEGLPPNAEGRRVLPGRTNIVLTRDAPSYGLVYGTIGPLQFMEDPQEAVRRGHWLSETGQVFIVGGEQVYRAAFRLGLADEVIASEIHQDYEGDARFPALGDDWQWQESLPCEGYDLVRYTRSA